MFGANLGGFRALGWPVRPEVVRKCFLSTSKYFSYNLEQSGAVSHSQNLEKPSKIMIFTDFRLYKLLKDLVDFHEFSKKLNRWELAFPGSGAPSTFIFDLRVL